MWRWLAAVSLVLASCVGSSQPPAPTSLGGIPSPTPEVPTARPTGVPAPFATPTSTPPPMALPTPPPAPTPFRTPPPPTVLASVPEAGRIALNLSDGGGTWMPLDGREPRALLSMALGRFGSRDVRDLDLAYWMLASFGSYAFFDSVAWSR